MLGAVIGDIVGSRFEWRNHKSKDFELFTPNCRFTDDSVLTFAIASALLLYDGTNDLEQLAVEQMHTIGNLYPNAGFGGKFIQWLQSPNPQPYFSFGNGAAMRISPVGFAARSPEEVHELTQAVTSGTHNHYEAYRGAEAVSMSIFWAREGASQEEIRQRIRKDYYPLDQTLDEIRPDYKFNVTCLGSVPQAIEAFLEASDFEDAIRNAISIGGDSDTIAAMAGGIAEAFFGIPDAIREKALTYLDPRMTDILDKFEAKFPC